MSVGSAFVVGIDLGTTNSAVAYIDLREEHDGFPPVRIFDVPQLVAAGQVAPRPLLPSFVYLPGEFELPAGSTALPWAADRRFIVGEFARQQGSVVPGRSVASAKSWMCHTGVDRRADLLPWGGADDVRKMSPVAASAAVLQHIREAWDHQFAREDESLRLGAQEVVLTVPASFDEVARELTCEAAEQAGLHGFTLLEEPQAAFYCWIREHLGQWKQSLPQGGTILVCDIGGGTTDLSLISARPGEGDAPPTFERLAVGAHLLLGGDNMDLTLARHLESGAGRSGRLSARQWTLLAHRCRQAKEELLAETPPESVRVTIPGSSSRVIGGALTKTLDPSTADSILLDGFFPAIDRNTDVSASARPGIQEFGLPFESEPAIPLHILRFLRSQAGNVPDDAKSHGVVRPDVLLFNGGATRAPRVRQRLVDTIGSWFAGESGLSGDWQPGVLDNDRPDLAVAYGAAYYGAVRRGLGVRIRGGSARAYYVSVGGQAESPEQASLLCLLPHGLEEGKEVEVERDLALLTNQPVRFPAYSSSTRLGDEPGDLVDVDVEELTPLPPIQTVLQFGKKGSQQRIPVHLLARVTEIGTLAMSCRSLQSEHRWKLEFDLRQAWSADDASGSTSMTSILEDDRIDAARGAILQCFADGRIPPEGLVRGLEEALEMKRSEWPSSALRSLWDTLRDVADHRRRSAAHEARWLNLAGYCLRPGRGLPGDEIRVRELWSAVFSDGIVHRRDAQNLCEWWILWRRVSGGLTTGQQIQLYGSISPLILAKKVDTFKVGRGAPDKAELRELWLAAASFERLEPSTRRKLGDVASKFLTTKQLERFGLLVLGRLGARQPLYAGANAALDPNVAGKWLRAILDGKWPAPEKTAFDVVQLARRTGDRSRDVQADLRDRLRDSVRELPAADRLQALLDEPAQLGQKEQSHLLGDALPPGLVLVDSDS